VQGLADHPFLDHRTPGARVSLLKMTPWRVQRRSRLQSLGIEAAAFRTQFQVAQLAPPEYFQHQVLASFRRALSASV
jgi:hypothetical protein